MKDIEYLRNCIVHAIGNEKTGMAESSEEYKQIKELRKNIEILDADYRNDVIGVKLVVFIKDNNRKFFKKRVLTRLLWELSDVPYMQKNIESIIDEYLFYHYQYKITNYSNDKVLKEWKESREK